MHLHELLNSVALLAADFAELSVDGAARPEHQAKSSEDFGSHDCGRLMPFGFEPMPADPGIVEHQDHPSLDVDLDDLGHFHQLGPKLAQIPGVSDDFENRVTQDGVHPDAGGMVQELLAK